MLLNIYIYVYNYIEHTNYIIIQKIISFKLRKICMIALYYLK